ncbi:MAG TPA: phosphate/phosphite/phosphonate ABC transporter substrate-binding protein [Desulfobacteraceae bacterium]|nr:phosphate/phosphite/phosphonate ABC transporter substrate-binding protein [Desulfobacteraceae bacterium]
MTSLTQAIPRRICWAYLIVPLSVLLMYFCFATQIRGEERHRELLIGIEPEHNIFDQVQRYRALAAYLSDQLGLKVKLTIMSRYGEVIQRFRSLRLDGALLSSYTASLAIRELGLIPVVNLVNPEEGSTSQGYIFVRKDSGIKNVSDMRDRSVVFVDPATTEGYVFARAFFRQHGIDDLDSFFSRHYFSGSHASAVFAVLDGRADIGSAKNTVYNQLVARDRSILNELSIIATSPEVPEVTLCLKSDLAPEVLEKLRTALLKMDETVEGHKVLKQLAARRFVRASPDDFAVVSDMAEDAGIKMLNGSSNR